MRRLAEGDELFSSAIISEHEARAIFSDQPLKIELIDDLLARSDQGDTEPKILSTFTVGDFVDLCRGPHISGTKTLNPDALKLLTASGAYWRGDSSRQSLIRIYGTACRWPVIDHDLVVTGASSASRTAAAFRKPRADRPGSVQGRSIAPTDARLRIE